MKDVECSGATIDCIKQWNTQLPVQRDSYGVFSLDDGGSNANDALSSQPAPVRCCDVHSPECLWMGKIASAGPSHGIDYGSVWMNVLSGHVLLLFAHDSRWGDLPAGRATMRLVGARSAGLVTEAPHFVTAHEPAVVDASARIASAHGVTSGQVNGTSVPVIVLDSPRLCITYEEEMEPAALDQRRKHSVHRCLLTAAITKADSCNVPLLMSASWRQRCGDAAAENQGCGHETTRGCTVLVV